MEATHCKHGLNIVRRPCALCVSDESELASLRQQLTEAREKLRTDCPLATDGTCKDLTALEQENKRLLAENDRLSKSHTELLKQVSNYESEQALKKEVEK